MNHGLIKHRHSTIQHIQQGLSLIEMMISIALGMVILLGVTSIYLSSQKSAGVRDAIGEMEANARGALSGIRQIVEHAGYPSIYNIPLEKPFHSAEDGAIDLATRCRKGTEKLVLPATLKDQVTQDNNDRDWIVVKYRSDDPNDPNAEIITDCTGSITPTQCSADPHVGMYNPRQAIVYNALHISDEHILTCIGSRNITAQPIATNISFIQFLYGVKTAAGIRYLPATAVETNRDWERVISVQVAILVRSDKNVLERQTLRHFYLLNHPLTRNDKRLYRIYSTTINLPNRNRRVL